MVASIGDTGEQNGRIDMVFHIRRQLRKQQGSQYYKDRSNRGQGTYCGEAETIYDVNTRRDAVAFNGREPCRKCIKCYDNEH